ncbi:hypothetical protein SCP_0806050 [Sparassis crispa]|uniref:Uncharacterized protein n=1 Tax=Sparassis crispa TaxID=139825 RepID=A0A401GV20_9APHY|nr:hypothetical protein SCP_0806050 [Sparassis crispa]GBE86081.1 hypothetical protein SCP_0806050 [Sparassis crispa]
MEVIHAPFEIASIATFHPDIPLPLVTKLSLDLEVPQDSEITSATVKQAEDIIRVLEGTKDYEETITEDVIQTAKDQVYTLRDITSQFKFRDLTGVDARLDSLEEKVAVARTESQDQMKTLMDQMKSLGDKIEILVQSNVRLEASLEALPRIEARQENMTIVKKNAHMMRANTGLYRYASPLKVIAGDGLALAQQLLPQGRNTVPEVAVGNVGTVLWDVIDISDLDHNKILRLIRYYNQDFEIQAADVLPARIQKILNYLIGQGNGY